MACQYVFQGKTYNKRSILNAIKDGDVVLGDIQTARENIRKILNMNDSEIELVRGLIDNDAVGAFTQDGRILLSDRFVQGEEYHEAFHRVFRTVFSDAQRKALFKEYRNREGFQESLDQKRKLYPNQSTEELIEEVLADEFMMYQLANGNYVVPKPIQNAFQRILNFIRKLLGLKDIAGVYESIRAGNYKSVKPKFYKSTRLAKSKVKVGNLELDVFQKNEILDAVIAKFSTSFIEEVSDKDSFEDVDINRHLIDGIENVIDLLREDFSSSKKQQLANSIEDDALVYIPVQDIEGNFYTQKNINANSPIVEELTLRLDQLRIKTKEETPEPEELNDEEAVTNDYAFLKASWETNPEDNITLAMKIFATSIESSQLSDYYALPKPEPYGKVIMTLFKVLKNATHNWDVVKNLLENNVDINPWIQTILDRLQNNLKLRTQFVRSFVKAHYDMYSGIWVKEELQVQPLEDETRFISLIREIKDYINILGDRELIVSPSLSDPNLSTKEKFRILTGIELSDEILKGTINTSKGLTTGEEIADNIIAVTRTNINEGVQYKDLFNNKVYRPTDKSERPEDYSVLGNLRRLLNEYNKYRPNEQGVVLNHNRDRVWPWTTHTYQKQVESALNLVANLTPSELATIDSGITEGGLLPEEVNMQKRIAKLRELLPWFVDYKFNFYVDENGLTKTNSLILKRILEQGDTYSISIFSGMRLDDGTDAKDLLTPDMIPMYIRSMSGLEPKYISVKHGDRGAIFAGGFESKVKYTDDITAQDYLASLLLDEINLIRDSKTYSVFKKMGDGNLKIFEFLDIDANELQTLVNDMTLTSNKLHKKYKESFDKYVEGIEADFKNLLKEVYANFEGRRFDDVFTKPGETKVPFYTTAEVFSMYKNDEEILIKEVVKNYLIHFHEDMRVFVGYAGEYPNMVNLFKRIQSLSSSGTPLVNDGELNSYIDNKNQQDAYAIITNGEVEMRTYGDRNLKQKGKIKEKVLTGPRVSYTQAEKENLAAIHKANLIKEGFPEKIAEKRAEEWVSVFNKYEEADGVTFTNMFFYREYKDRLGEWNQNMENAFQIELAILNQNDLNPEVFFAEGDRVFANRPANLPVIRIKAFDLSNENAARVFNKLEPFTMLKPVYTGPVEHQGATVNGIRKTALHVILPSMVFGTDKMQSIHDYMLRNNVDMIALDSATKKAVPSNVEDINLKIYSTNEDTFTILDTMYLKEQVKMSNDEKGRIKNATQSTTIVFTNIFEEDPRGFSKPKDYTGERPWNELTDEEKLAQSKVFTKYTKYKEALDAVVTMHMDRVKEDLGVVNDNITDIELVTEILRTNINVPSVRDALNYVTEAKSLDLLPSFNRIEPALLSIVSNEAVRIKRPGEMLAQYSVYGMDEVTISGVKSKRLQNYRIEGNVIRPAEIIVPLPKSMAAQLMKRFKTNNLVEAIQRYNKNKKKIIVKGLRIPNQQLSFNGIYEIKEFALPTMQNYIVLPSEIVPVSSSDFDIDKQQVYWPILDDRGNMVQTDEARVYNRLLQAEIDLLLDPSNFHTLMAPVNEAWFSKDLFKDILIKRGEYTAEQLNSDEKLENAVIKFTFKEIGNIASQIRTAINMTQSKLNVGLMATNAKMYPVGQADSWKASSVVANEDDVLIANLIPFEGDKQHFFALYDSDYRHITEIISTLMTSQLDGVKNPYAVALNIVKNSIGPMMFMVRRGMPINLIARIIASPVVMRYNTVTNLFKSNSAKARRIYPKTSGQNNVLHFMYSFKGKSAIENYLNEFKNRDRIVSSATVLKALSDKTLKTEDSLQVLAGYMYVEELAKAMLEISTAMTPDTKPLGNMSMVDVMFKKYQDFADSFRRKAGMINQDFRTGFLKPFYNAQKLYQLFGNLYFTRKDKLANYLTVELGTQVSAGAISVDDRARVKNTFVNDFKAYMFFKKLNESEEYKGKYTFDAIMTNSNLVDEIASIRQDETHPISTNYLIQNLIPITGIATDPDGTTPLYLLKLRSRGDNALHLYDLYQNFEDLVDSVVGTEYEASMHELVRKLIAYNVYTTGFGFSPFTLDDAVSPRLVNKLYKEIDFYNTKVTEEDVTQFANLFVAMNPNVFRFKIKPKKNETNFFRNVRYKWDGTFTANETNVTILGNSYAKRYDSKVPEYLTISVPRGTQAQVQPTPATEQEIYKWARYSQNSYEVSSQGDKRFSALYATLKDGRTIEEAYQLDVKGYRSKGNDWRLGKGKAPLRNISREQSWEEYKQLWRTYLNENPELLKELQDKARGKVLTDKFASTDISQARALAEILNEKSIEQQIPDELTNQCK
jgi:hypothetical protein